MSTAGELEQLAAELVEVHRWEGQLRAKLLEAMQAAGKTRIDVPERGRVTFVRAHEEKPIDREKLETRLALYASLLRDAGIQDADGTVPLKSVPRSAGLRVTLR